MQSSRVISASQYALAVDAREAATSKREAKRMTAVNPVIRKRSIQAKYTIKKQLVATSQIGSISIYKEKHLTKEKKETGKAIPTPPQEGGIALRI